MKLTKDDIYDFLRNFKFFLFGMVCGCMISIYLINYF